MGDTVTLSSRDPNFDAASMEALFSKMPGFAVFKAAPTGQIFAKFCDASFAQQAVGSAQASGIPAVMARSSMRMPDGGELQQPPPPADIPAGGYDGDYEAGWGKEKKSAGNNWWEETP